MLDRAGINISMIQKAVGPMAKVITAARQAGIDVIYLKMGYRSDLSDLGAEGSPNRTRNLLIHVGDTMTGPGGLTSRILVRDNWGTEIIPLLKPRADEIVLYKTRFSGFYETDLDTILKRLGKTHLVIIGCTTSNCIESTVRDAMFRDYSPIVLEDCAGEPDGFEFARSNHEASLFLIQAEYGWVTSSDEFIKALRALNRP
jgi:ureidoacrylate peracid hydrolase